MKFSCNKEISYEEAVTTMFEKLGNAQIMALASSLNDYVMVRNVSCLFYDEKIYFKLDIENPIIRINTAFKGCSSLEKISVLPRIYHN